MPFYFILFSLIVFYFVICFVFYYYYFIVFYFIKMVSICIYKMCRYEKYVELAVEFCNFESKRERERERERELVETWYKNDISVFHIFVEYYFIQF